MFPVDKPYKVPITDIKNLRLYLEDKKEWVERMLGKAKATNQKDFIEYLEGSLNELVTLQNYLPRVGGEKRRSHK